MSTRENTLDKHHLPRAARPSTPPPVLRALAMEAGVEFNGPHPWDIQVHDPAVYRRILAHGSLGFGEAYMDGQWDCERLDELFHRLLSIDVDRKLVGLARVRLAWQALRFRLLNLQSEARAFLVGEKHYDIGNDVFEAMLDSSMSYSCGYWAKANSLEEAQRDKLDLICRKLELKPGEHVLEIGCGWGGLARHAARHYGVRVTGITVSKAQRELALQRCQGLPVDIHLMDYRAIQGSYDKVVSVGMFEHVGSKNYPLYFETVRRVMKDEGLFLLHTIGSHRTAPHVDPWIDRYIFPNGKLPSALELAASLEGVFLIEDWHNFGPDYDRTLMAWWNNFEAAWPRLSRKYDERFHRMWKYYLHSCAGFFRARQGQLWQLVLSKRERAGEYRSVR